MKIIFPVLFLALSAGSAKAQCLGGFCGLPVARVATIVNLSASRTVLAARAFTGRIERPRLIVRSRSVVRMASPALFVPVPQVIPVPMPAPAAPKKTTTTTTTTTTTSAVDALDLVNAKRARLGLRPFIRDEGLTQGAVAAAAYRARVRLFGHTSNDFAFLPAGVHAAFGGCAGNSPSWGFMACGDDSRTATYAGAAFAMGADGRMYCHLFAR